MEELQFKYDFAGLDIHSAINVSENVRTKIKTFPKDCSKQQEAQLEVLGEFNTALTEYIYAQMVLMERERIKEQ
jgi:hypothetical protein